MSEDSFSQDGIQAERRRSTRTRTSLKRKLDYFDITGEKTKTEDIRTCIPFRPNDATRARYFTPEAFLSFRDHVAPAAVETLLIRMCTANVTVLYSDRVVGEWSVLTPATGSVETLASENMDFIICVKRGKTTQYWSASFYDREHGQLEYHDPSGRLRDADRSRMLSLTCSLCPKAQVNPPIVHGDSPAQSPIQDNAILLLMRARELVAKEKSADIASCRLRFASEYATSSESVPPTYLRWTSSKKLYFETASSEPTASQARSTHRRGQIEVVKVTAYVEASAYLLKTVHAMHAARLERCAAIEQALSKLQDEEEGLEVWIRKNSTEAWTQAFRVLEELPLSDAEAEAELTRNEQDREVTRQSPLATIASWMREGAQVMETRINEGKDRLEAVKADVASYKAEIPERWLQAKVCIVLARKAGARFRHWEQEHRRAADKAKTLPEQEMEVLRVRHKEQIAELIRKQEEEKASLQAAAAAVLSG